MKSYGTITSNHGRDQWHRVGMANDYSVVRHAYIPDVQVEISSAEDWDGDSAVGQEGQRGDG